MKICIVTIFPKLFAGTFDFGMVQQARKKGLLEIQLIDLRSYAGDERGTVDDRPYGGGEGMVLKPDVVFSAVERCQKDLKGESHIILLSPRGSRFDQKKARELSLKKSLILICGRYEGVDQRVADHLVHEELSVGDFVLSGGEFAALLVTDAVARLISGVVGRQESVLEESFMEGLLDYPHYTRPAKFREWAVPEVLLSGDHDRIERWRRQQALEATRRRRPDLLSEEDLEDRLGTDER